MNDPICVKQIGQGKTRVTKKPSAIPRQSKRNNKTSVREKMPKPMRSPSSTNLLKRKNFEFERMEEITTTEFPLMNNEPKEIDTKMQRVCYITNWSRYRTGEAKFEIEYIDPFMCSHIIYAYATVDDEKPEIIPIQKEDFGNEEFGRVHGDVIE